MLCPAGESKRLRAGCEIRQRHVAVLARFRRAAPRPPVSSRSARGGRGAPAAPTKRRAARHPLVGVRNRRRASRAAPSPGSPFRPRSVGCPRRPGGWVAPIRGIPRSRTLDTCAGPLKVPQTRRVLDPRTHTLPGCELTNRCSKAVYRPASVAKPNAWPAKAACRGPTERGSSQPLLPLCVSPREGSPAQCERAAGQWIS